LLLDLTNGKRADIVKAITISRPIIRGAPVKSLLTLTDATNIDVSAISTPELVAFVKENKPYVKAAAVVGVSDPARTALATTRILTGRAVMLFDTRTEAMEWLSSRG
jgi:hypothetical protein